MTTDVERLAETLGLERYAVLGHSFGALVALQHAVDFSGPAGGERHLVRLAVGRLP